MSIEGRLTSLQAKLDQLLDMVKLDPLDKPGGGNLSTTGAFGSSGIRGAYSQSRLPAPEYPHKVRSPQAEIRSLELWRCVVAECLGTLCYVFFVCGVSIPWTGHFPPFLSVAFASALAYGALTYQVFPGSHLNPAFTIALTSIKYISPLRCILFLTAQAGGAIAGAAVLFSLTVPGYQGTLGATTIASHINPAQAFGMELILCFVMTLTFITDPGNSLPTTAVLLAANLVALPCTGAGLNPVRSLGPAFVMNKWPSHWVFWLGPILGGLAAAYLHRFILRRSSKNKQPKEVRDQVPSDGDSLDIPVADLPTSIPDKFVKLRVNKVRGWLSSLKGQPQQQQEQQRLRQHSDNLSSLVSTSSTARVTSPIRLVQVAPSTERDHNIINLQQLENGRRDNLNMVAAAPPPVPSRNGTLRRSAVVMMHHASTTGQGHPQHYQSLQQQQQQQQDVYESFYDLQRQQKPQIEFYYNVHNSTPPPPPPTSFTKNNPKYQIYSV